MDVVPTPVHQIIVLLGRVVHRAARLSGDLLKSFLEVFNVFLLILCNFVRPGVVALLVIRVVMSWLRHCLGLKWKWNPTPTD